MLRCPLFTTPFNPGLACMGWGQRSGDLRSLKSICVWKEPWTSNQRCGLQRQLRGPQEAIWNHCLPESSVSSSV